MSTQKPSSNSKEVDNVSTRVKNTKKEIELLKADLEKLISTGVRSAKTPPKENQVPEQVLKASEPIRQTASTKKTVTVSQTKPEPNKNSPKKPRSYDVAEAREYIKKQKEKRAEQLKTQINVTDNKIDLKKQKLKELHQKTRELVSKNVQLKRERSKSRDKEAPVRPDKSNLVQEQPKNFQESLRPNSLDKGKIVRLKSQERVPQQNVQKIRPKVQKSEQEVAQVAVASDRASRSRTRPEKPAPPPILSFSGREIDTNLLYPPNVIPQKTDLDGVLEKTVLPPFDSKTGGNVEQKTWLEHSIMTDACLRDSKETQTNNLVETLWLKPPPLLPYPYNFINTVKRKLQCAINSPRNYVDVGVQNSERGTPEMGPKSKEEIKEMLVKSAASDLKSFASHKCPNLDIEAVKNLELKKSNEILSKNLFVDYDSESDTSKNIPDISSESFASSQRHGDSEPILNLHGLRNLKLHAPKLTASKSSSHIKTDSQGYPEWSHNNGNSNYSSEFVNESGSQRSSGSVKTITRGKASQHSSHSSIKTITSEKQSQFLNPSTSYVLSTNQNSHKSATIDDQYALGEPLKFRSLLIEGQTSGSTMESSSEAERTIPKPTVNNQGDGLVLKEPTISLNFRKGHNGTSSTSQDSQKQSDSKSSTSKKEEKNLNLAKSRMKNITIRPALSTNNEVNEIHLKFEAEVRLLSDFNESFKQFVAVEKAFENLKNQNDANVAITKIMQNVDTQTSFLTKTSTNVTNSSGDRKNSTINYSRGSDIIEELNDLDVTNNRNVSKSLQNSSFSTDFDLISNLNRSSNVSTEDETKVGLSVANVENYDVKNCAGLSLNMFEQLIKDEDTRIQHLKAIIKIREQALLDRTKGELVWLEIQKKQLIETGNIEEASLLKKKQRGIILKHEQERNEIKKLKQMQKEASEERKNILKRQRNLIKSQLSTNNMLSKIKVKTPRERRSSGPLRVVQSCSESVHSETSISMRSSDVLSITSHSVRLSESEVDFSREAKGKEVSNAKRALSMREAALQKRRKAAEELLRWHRKLLDEEKKIAELEAAATSVIGRLPKEESVLERHEFNGKQLNQLWRSMTGRDERKFAEEKVYAMSQVALERLCKCARQHSNKNRKSGDVASDSDSANKTKTDNYSSVFETESVQEIINSQEEKTKISSISELIDNFSRIEDEISTISRKSEHDITSLEEQVDEESQPSSQISVLKTMTPNHVSEPEEIETVKIQEDETSEKRATEIESAITDEKEVSSNKESSSPETIEDLEEIPSEKIEEEESTEAATEKSIPSKEIPSEKIEEESTETPAEESISSKEEIPSEKIVEEESTEAAAEESISSKIQTKEPTESSVPSKIDGENSNATWSKTEVEESIKTTQTSATVSEAIASSNEKTEELPISSKETLIPPVVLDEDQISSREEPEIPSLALDEALESASKIEESLSKLNEQLSNEKKDEISEELSSLNQVQSLDGSISEEKTPQKKATNQIDVKKRVSEILADTSPHRGDKSPRVQDLYVTAYDVGGPNLPEFAESLEDGRPMPTSIFGSEAEELWRKQLAIEQEIKQLEQQQKEQLPYVFMREIPNKPPPPYTPPSSLSSLPQSVLPSGVKEINEISNYSCKVLYKAYLNNTLEKVKFSENGFKLFSKVEVSKMCAEFVFNICRDIAREIYRQFETVEEASWLTSTKKPQLAKTKPPDAVELDRIINSKLRELFGFKTVRLTESAIVKWGRKKRDHVDEILVVESQEEESQWISFDSDELFVKDQITKDIMRMLLDETASVFSKIVCKKNVVG